MTVIAVGLVGFTAMPQAQAAVIDGAVQSVTVTPTNPRVRDPIRSNVTFCVPDGTNQGDYFTLTMPEHLTGFPRNFPLRDPNGDVVARVAVSTATPAVATFTMTGYVETHQNVCGSATFESVFTDAVLPGTTETLSFTENDTVDFTDTVDVRDVVGVNRRNPRKDGDFADPSDQCRTNPTDCIEWRIDSPAGPFDSAHFVDPADEGQTFSCASVVVYRATVDADGLVTSRTDVTSASTIRCTDTLLDVTTGPAGANEIMSVRYRSSATTAAPLGDVLFVNTAEVSTTRQGVIETDPVEDSIRSGTAFGEGVGDNITIVKTDSDGNDADTAAAAVSLSDGTAALRFTITNTGADNLVDVAVSDRVVQGGTISGLSCRFPGGTSGTTWAGPFAPGASFTCTASLAGVEPGTTHEDIASVTAIGETTRLPVSASNPYHAVTAARVTPTPSTPAITPPAATPDTPVEATAVELADTGADPAPLVVGALVLLAAGTVLMRLSRLRRR
jgi:hypothetical protein